MSYLPKRELDLNDPKDQLLDRQVIQCPNLPCSPGTIPPPVLKTARLPANIRPKLPIQVTARQKADLDPPLRSVFLARLVFGVQSSRCRFINLPLTPKPRLTRFFHFP